MFFVGAIYISPIITGSANEKKMTSSPHELESGYTAYEDSVADNSNGTNTKLNAV